MQFKSFSEWWNQVRSSLWFVPSVCVLGAVVLSLIVPEVDRYLIERDLSPPTWLFAGSASGARSILSTVAGSLITIVGVLFSITIVILQQASNRYTPRVMGNFMRQTGTQLTLGVYLATFLYALLVLRYIRGEDSPANVFVPAISVTLSVLMATICLGFLVYFIHHMASSLQASSVIANVRKEFQFDIETLYPDQVGEPKPDPNDSPDVFRKRYMSGPAVMVTATSSGYLRSVDDESIATNVPDAAAVMILPQIGEFIISGTPLVEIGNVSELESGQQDGVRESLILGRERSRYEDPLFSIRQLVDIALIALSTGINDPTTANNAISMLGDTLANLATREFPSRTRVLRHGDEGVERQILVWANRPSFAEHVSATFTEIRREALSNVAVTAHLVDTIAAVADSITLRQRAEPLHEELDEILRALESSGFSERDTRLLRNRIEAARRRLPARSEGGVQA